MNLLRLELVLRLDIDKTGARQMLAQGVGGDVVIERQLLQGRKMVAQLGVDQTHQHGAWQALETAERKHGRTPVFKG